jgi:transcriptional regulator with XRE-family HTH domain
MLRCLTLEDVAEATGIDKANLSRLERGRQPLKGEARRRLAEFYEVAPDQLETPWIEIQGLPTVTPAGSPNAVPPGTTVGSPGLQSRARKERLNLGGEG